MGKLFVVVAMLAGCAAEPEPELEPIPQPIIVGDMTVDASDDLDVCALAEALPAEDDCSLACDPVGLAERMTADGAAGGRCYQLYCALTDEIHISVGVCLL